jgi:hypothetical protein
MDTSQAILERWVSQTIESYPAQMHSFLRSEDDPFRNPVGNAIKENLGALVRELMGTMDRDAIISSLGAILRLRAVQDLPPTEAVRFIFDLRAIVHEVTGKVDQTLQSRIDSLALTAFDQFMICREQIAELRIKEIHLRALCAAQ